jgi:hypothetical protein
VLNIVDSGLEMLSVACGKALIGGMPESEDEIREFVDLVDDIVQQLAVVVDDDLDVDDRVWSRPSPLAFVKFESGEKADAFIAEVRAGRVGPFECFKLTRKRGEPLLKLLLAAPAHRDEWAQKFGEPLEEAVKNLAAEFAGSVLGLG